MKFIIIYLLIINAVGLVLMRSDKKRSKNNRWRIPERTLIGIAILGGSVGIIAGMRIFHHKTMHAKFYIGIPLILSVQIIASVLLLSQNLR